MNAQFRSAQAMRHGFPVLFVVLFTACSSSGEASSNATTTSIPTTSPTTSPDIVESTESPSESIDDVQQFPDVISASAERRSDNTVNIDATLSSPYDTPDRYADAWRVLDPDDAVLGVRELLHDHAGEQPFTRSLDGVVIPDDVMWVTIEGRDLVHGWGGQTVRIDIPPPEEGGTTAASSGGEKPLTVSVWDVTSDGEIPTQFTCDGSGSVLTVGLTAVPEGTVEFALIVDDPDAPTPTPFVHWVVYGMNVTTRSISDDDARFTYGTNDNGEMRWFSPCPPSGSGPHTYRWRLFAINERLEERPGLSGPELEAAIAARTVEVATFNATYERP